MSPAQLHTSMWGHHRPRVMYRHGSLCCQMLGDKESIKSASHACGFNCVYGDQIELLSPAVHKF
eukprot:3890747-Amphidinium_carterae.1